MAIDANETLRQCSNYVFGSSFLNGLLSSSLTVALVISAVMVLLIAVLYPAKPGTSFMILGKMFIYMFGISVLVIFLHDSVIRYSMKEHHHDGQTNDFLRGTYQPNPTVMKTYGAGEILNGVSGGSDSNSAASSASNQNTQQQTTQSTTSQSMATTLGGLEAQIYGGAPPKKPGNPYA